MNKYKIVCIGFIAQLLFSCAPSLVVRPLQKGEKQVSANLGGPLMGFAGTTIPIPLSAVSYAQGVSDKVTLFGGLHTTALIYGVIQTDIGACVNVYHPDSSQFGLSINPVVNIAYDKWEGNFKLWPEVDINAYWEFNPKKSFTYIGISNWFELSSKRAHEETQENRWLINPHIGYTYVRKKWNYNFETKWLVPNVDTKPNVVDYKGVNGKGGIGIYFTFTRKF
jgi:hypothetical protein